MMYSLQLSRYVRNIVVSSTILLSSALIPFQAEAVSQRLRPVSGPLYGMTQDGVEDVNAIIASADHLARFPTNRIVFDEGVGPSYYAPKVEKIRSHSYVMGEILDSAYVRSYSVRRYHNRVAHYLAKLGTNVDIWEVGNEVNGEWLGRTPIVVKKMVDAYKQTRAKGYRTALTLYYNPGCWSKRANRTFKWAAANVPKRMKSKLDYVFLSYYEQDCNGLRLSEKQWQAVFNRLHAMFPNSKIGFGEIGADPNRSLAYRKDYMKRYYGLHISTPNYVGGYFWWYGRQDLTPWNKKPLWRTLNRAITGY